VQALLPVSCTRFDKVSETAGSVPRTAIAAVPPYAASRIAQLHKFLDKWNLVLVVIDGPLAL
jgi:hypothetical protein